MKNTWTTQSGQTFAIKDMTDGHLLNTVKYLQTNADRLKMQIALKQSELEIGEMALQAISVGQLSNKEFLENHTPIKAMLKELKKRGIEVYD